MYCEYVCTWLAMKKKFFFNFSPMNCEAEKNAQGSEEEMKE